MVASITSIFPLSSARPVSRAARFTCESLDRREVLCGGGTLTLAMLLGGARPVRAQGLSGSVPEVDRVAVSVVTDSYQFAVAPSRKIGVVDIEHFGWGITPDQPPGRTLISEFGLSMHVETQRADESRNILIDFGFTPQALTNNTALLGIDPGRLDALVLSHGHFDHFGGLSGYLKEASNRLMPGLPLYVGGEDCFCARTWTAGPVKGDFGVLDRTALQDAKIRVVIAEQPSLVADHAFTTGQITLRGFEKLLSPSAMKIGVEKGSGCYPERMTDAQRQQGTMPDQFQHELATAFNLKGRGLVVLTSCSHRGVVNALKQAQATSGVTKVHAVIGGFHLAPYQPDYVAQTIAALAEIDPDYIVPLHCTGEAFFEAAKAAMPTKLIRAYTGTRLVFTA
jgi:7,8-dihydropterin-6-yl-methyl-4-(beta-D-ribofuranosyl)aminobenzene 5'-phosphate synthase